MVATICMLVPLSVAVVTDIRSHTIYNWTVYPGILLALLISLVATVSGRDLIQGTSYDVARWGIPHIWSALGGLLGCGVIMLVCYVFFPGSLGGGDVKLMAMLGAFWVPPSVWRSCCGPSFWVAVWVGHFGVAGGVLAALFAFGASRQIGRCRSGLVALDGRRETAAAGAIVPVSGGMDSGGYCAFESSAVGVATCIVKR